MQLSQKQKTFAEFLSASLKTNLNIFNEKMTLIVDVFLKLRTPKNVVNYISKKSSSRGSFDKQHGKREKNTVQIRITPPLPYILITVKAIELEKSSHSDMQNLRTFF